MYYFLNENLNKNGSGIEHAQVERLHLFRRHGQPAAIVTINFNRYTHRFLKDTYDLEPEELVNVYDYFGDSQKFIGQPITIDEITSGDIQGNKIYEHGRVMMDYQNNADGTLDFVQYYDADGILLQKDLYDSRGFKALVQKYAKDELDNERSTWLSSEDFYAPNGQNYLSKFYRKRPNGVVMTNMVLTDRLGRVHSFLNQNQLYQFLLECLDVDGENVYISDRSRITNPPMLGLKGKKIEFFHSIHFRDYWNPNSPLTYNSIANTDQLNKLDLILAPTANQAQDLRTRLRTEVPVKNVSVGIVAPQAPSKQRIQGKVVIVARIFAEKHLDAAIRAIAKVHETLPGVTLDIYGYPDGQHKELDKLKKLVTELALEQVVTFKGYQNDLQAVYDSAELMLLTSRYEGFCLAILEAFSHGVPCVTFETNYGTKYLVEDDQSGYVVPFDDVAALAQRAYEVLNDTQLQQRLSAGAYKRAEDFSDAAVWHQWENILATL